MGSLDILERLESAGVSIEVAGERLRLRPGSRVSADLAQAIRERKRDLICTLLVLREAEAIALMAQAQHIEAEVTELRALVAVLESRS